jgi:quercetin dioxygenase-like cupin family protein
MGDRTIHNPVTGERATFIETARESAGVRSVFEAEITPGGGVFPHRHGIHEERIEVVEGEIEVTVGGVTRRVPAGEHVVIEPGLVHTWRNPSADRTLRFRAMMIPGHPGFETALRVAFGLGRDGGLRPSGIPRRFADLALLSAWDPSLLAVGPRRLLAPLMRWSARRTRTRRRAAELLRRYGDSDPSIR